MPYGYAAPESLCLSAFTVEGAGDLLREGRAPPLRSFDIKLLHRFIPGRCGHRPLQNASQTPQHSRSEYFTRRRRSSSANADFTCPKGRFHGSSAAFASQTPQKKTVPEGTVFSIKIKINPVYHSVEVMPSSQTISVSRSSIPSRIRLKAYSRPMGSVWV